ncbi:conserved hypothetical protein, secreted [Candidatus Magnetomorum sp. HK-1]|nr:conserved hypothetical protein, secreted [Candidatus Magnetomorum sp. HK-1]
MKIAQCLLIISIYFFVLHADIALSEQPITAFYPGEKLTYRLKWGYISAGQSVLEVLPDTKIGSQHAFHFQLKAQTNSFIDRIYRVRDQIDAYAAIDMSRSVHYKKRVREGRTKRDIVVKFDWSKQQATYSNFEQKKSPIQITMPTFDPLSAFYYVRMFDPYNAAQISASVSDGKKCVSGKVRYIKKEFITVPFGTFATWLMEPDIKDVGGVFEKSKNAKIQIWVTDDERRIPVLLKSKVIVGSFYAELMKIE